MAKLLLAGAFATASAFQAPGGLSARPSTSLFASGHAVIVQNKGGGHGEIGFHLAKALAAKDLDVTIVQDAAAKKEALPFSLYGELSAEVVWCDMSDAAAVEKACSVEGLTHVYDNFAKSPADSAPMIAAAKASDAFKTYAFVSSAGMYTAKGILKEEKPVKDPPTGQREVELGLEAELPGQWCAFRPQYIYGPYTNKRDYLDWFLNRAARELPMAVPADAQQPVSLTHCEDVAALLASVVGKEADAADQIFNCGTNKMCSYDDVCIAAAKALGKPEALVVALPPDTKSSFPFRPNAEGFAVRVRKAMDVLDWPGAKHNVLDDLSGFYTEDFLALGLDKGDLDTSNDKLELCENMVQDYGERGVHV